jgi:hypothetical protein
MHGVNCTIQQETARKIMDALLRRREEDRRNYRVNPKLIEARNNQKRLEDQQERLVGY